MVHLHHALSPWHHKTSVLFAVLLGRKFGTGSPLLESPPSGVIAALFGNVILLLQAS